MPLTQTNISRLNFFSLYLIGLLLASASLVAAAAAPVGQIGLLEGTVVVTKASGKRIFVAEGSNLDAGDVIVTGTNSKAMLAFTDGGKIALRPNTVFQITEYQYNAEQPEADGALFQLLKGGLRTITGLIGKRGNKDAYRLGNPTATIGIRGTEYLARVCEPECDGEQISKEKTGRPIIRVQPIAKVLLVKGDAYREGVVTAGEKKLLAEGDALYQGDSVSTSASARLGILFTDASRIVLAGNTTFKLASYNFVADNPTNADSSMLVELLKGSARIVTGLIGKRNPTNVSYRTATATIGIRGTNFDMSCVDSGSAQGDTMSESTTAANSECDRAVVTTVREGAVEMDSGKGSQRIETGKTGYTDALATSPKLLSNNPKLFDDDVPLPESLSSDTGKHFGSSGQELGNRGIYVSVIEGKVVVQQGNQNLSLVPGESGFANANGKSLQLLSTAPSGINYDPFLKNVKFDAFSCGLK